MMNQPFSSSELPQNQSSEFGPQTIFSRGKLTPERAEAIRLARQEYGWFRELHTSRCGEDCGTAEIEAEALKHIGDVEYALELLGAVQWDHPQYYLSNLIDLASSSSLSLRVRREMLAAIVHYGDGRSVARYLAATTWEAFPTLLDETIQGMNFSSTQKLSFPPPKRDLTLPDNLINPKNLSIQQKILARVSDFLDRGPSMSQGETDRKREYILSQYSSLLPVRTMRDGGLTRISLPSSPLKISHHLDVFKDDPDIYSTGFLRQAAGSVKTVEDLWRFYTIYAFLEAQGRPDWRGSLKIVLFALRNIRYEEIPQPIMKGFTDIFVNRRHSPSVLDEDIREHCWNDERVASIRQSFLSMKKTEQSEKHFRTIIHAVHPKLRPALNQWYRDEYPKIDHLTASSIEMDTLEAFLRAHVYDATVCEVEWKEDPFSEQNHLRNVAHRTITLLCAAGKHSFFEAAKEFDRHGGHAHEFILQNKSLENIEDIEEVFFKSNWITDRKRHYLYQYPTVALPLLQTSEHRKRFADALKIQITNTSQNEDEITFLADIAKYGNSDVRMMVRDIVHSLFTTESFIENWQSAWRKYENHDGKNWRLQEIFYADVLYPDPSQMQLINEDVLYDSKKAVRSTEKHQTFELRMPATLDANARNANELRDGPRNPDHAIHGHAYNKFLDSGKMSSLQFALEEHLGESVHKQSVKEFNRQWRNPNPEVFLNDCALAFMMIYPTHPLVSQLLSLRALWICFYSGGNTKANLDACLDRLRSMGGTIVMEEQAVQRNVSGPLDLLQQFVQSGEVVVPTKVNVLDEQQFLERWKAALKHTKRGIITKTIASMGSTINAALAAVMRGLSSPPSTLTESPWRRPAGGENLLAKNTGNTESAEDVESAPIATLSHTLPLDHQYLAQSIGTELDRHTAELQPLENPAIASLIYQWSEHHAALFKNVLCTVDAMESGALLPLATTLAVPRNVRTAMQPAYVSQSTLPPRLRLENEGRAPVQADLPVWRQSPKAGSFSIAETTQGLDPLVTQELTSPLMSFGHFPAPLREAVEQARTMPAAKAVRFLEKMVAKHYPYDSSITEEEGQKAFAEALTETATDQDPIFAAMGKLKNTHPALTMLHRFTLGKEILGKGICGQQRYVLLACLRACGIMSMGVSGYAVEGKTVTREQGHAWNIAFVRDAEGKPFPMIADAARRFSALEFSKHLKQNAAYAGVGIAALGVGAFALKTALESSLYTDTSQESLRETQKSAGKGQAIGQPAQAKGVPTKLVPSKNDTRILVPPAESRKGEEEHSGKEIGGTIAIGLVVTAAVVYGGYRLRKLFTQKKKDVEKDQWQPAAQEELHAISSGESSTLPIQDASLFSEETVAPILSEPEEPYIMIGSIRLTQSDAIFAYEHVCALAGKQPKQIGDLGEALQEAALQMTRIRTLYVVEKETHANESFSEGQRVAFEILISGARMVLQEYADALPGGWESQNIFGASKVM